MVRLLPLLVKDPVSCDHVVHHVALGDLLGPELLRGGEVLTVVVPKVVVANDALGLDARVHLGKTIVSRMFLKQYRNSTYF